MLALLANWIPNPHPDFGTSPKPYITLMVLGFIVAVFGHITRTKTAVAIGVGVIFLATFLLPLVLYLHKSSG